MGNKHTKLKEVRTMDGPNQMFLGNNHPTKTMYISRSESSHCLFFCQKLFVVEVEYLCRFKILIFFDRSCRRLHDLYDPSGRSAGPTLGTTSTEEWNRRYILTSPADHSESTRGRECAKTEKNIYFIILEIPIMQFS